MKSKLSYTKYFFFLFFISCFCNFVNGQCYCDVIKECEIKENPTSYCITIAILKKADRVEIVEKSSHFYKIIYHFNNEIFLTGYLYKECFSESCLFVEER